MMVRRTWILQTLALSSWVLFARAQSAPRETVRVATTTSVDHSGLLPWLTPQLARETGVVLQVLAMGTGKALAVLGRGDADFGITHDPEAEEAFLARQTDWVRMPWLVGRFLLVGPRDDPAGVRGKGIVEALPRIADHSGARFVSRGDQSGTHAREEKLWRAAGVEVRAKLGGRYRAVGQGMGPTLLIANEMAAYTLTDEGSWLALEERLKNLAVLVSDDPLLDNPYALLLPKAAWAEESPTGRAARWLWRSRQAIAEGFMIRGIRPFRAIP